MLAGFVYTCRRLIDLSVCFVYTCRRLIDLSNDCRYGHVRAVTVRERREDGALRCRTAKRLLLAAWHLLLAAWYLLLGAFQRSTWR